MSGGSEEEGGNNEASRAYKDDPSIEAYVKLRRENPDAEIEVSVIGGLDQLFFLKAAIRKYGFDPAIVASAMDADPEAISELSLQIMEKMIEARKLASSGETHLMRRGMAVPDKLTNWLVACMLDALSWNDNLYIPRDLIVLLRERLGGSNPEYEQGSRAHQKRGAAIVIAAQFQARGIKPSFRMLGGILKVAPSTVMRWFPDGDLAEEVARVASWFDPDGKLRPAEEIIGRPLHTI